ncbi:MAG: hypothetical protein IT448_11025 [Phycisphaerales bacterium]|nr:hypothetical protein [Phycisphaerales bacterium]
MNLSRCLLMTLLVISPALGQMQPPDQRNNGGPSIQWRGRFFRWRTQQQQLWTQASEFAQRHTPNRWAFYDQLPDNSPVKHQLAELFMQTYQQIDEASDPGDALFELAAQRVAAEDEAWALGREIQLSQDSYRKEKLHQRLQELVRQIVGQYFEERQLRIERLKSAIVQQEEQLKQDRDNKEQLITQRMQRLLEAPDVSATQPAPAPENADQPEQQPLADQPVQPDQLPDPNQ